MAFFVIQNLVGLSALAFVGRAGDAALAGVGLGNVLFNLLLALVYGLDTGAQATISRAAGAEAPRLMGRLLTSALAIAAPLGGLLMLTAALAGPALVAAMIPDPRAAAAGAAFLRCAAPGLLLFCVTTACNSYWIASGRPGVSFGVTAVVAPCQVLLNALLIGGDPAHAAAGAGLATSFAALIGLAVQLLLAFRWRPIAGLFTEPPDSARMAAIARIGWPVSLQQSLAQVGLMAGFAIVARIGTADVAAVNVLANLMLLPIQIATGVGLAAATLVGQSMGGRDPQDAHRWGWRASGLGALVVAPIGVAVLVATRPVLHLFISEPGTIALAVWPARLLAATMSIDAITRILGFALRGAGATKTATFVPFVAHFLIELPLMVWLGLVLGYGLLGVVAAQVAMTIAEWIAFTCIWRGGGWQRVRIAAVDGPRETPVAGPPRRVAILGGAGAGKSTLARALGVQLGLPVTHLDRLMFGAAWTRVADREARERVTRTLQGDDWIVDGTYAAVNDLILPRADLVIWIDQPAWLRMLRAWGKARRHRDADRADRPDDCPEVFDLAYARTVLGFGAWTPQVEGSLRTEAPRARIVRLKGDRQIADLVASFAQEAPPVRPTRRRGPSAAPA